MKKHVVVAEYKYYSLHIFNKFMVRTYIRTWLSYEISQSIIRRGYVRMYQISINWKEKCLQNASAQQIKPFSKVKQLQVVQLLFMAL